jgi:hypothetical protein
MARRVITMTPPKTTGSDAAIDLPSTVNSNSVVAASVGDNSPLSILPSRVKQQQLLLQLPAGLVVVVDARGGEQRGSLVRLTVNEVVLKTDSVSELRLPNYRSLSFVSRWDPRISISYELGGLSWDAQHVMLVKDYKVVGFQTRATIRNNTGGIFNRLTDLVLSYERPNRSQGRAERSISYKMAAPMSAMMSQPAGAAPEYKSAGRRRVAVISDDQDTSSSSGGSSLSDMSGERGISLGPQELGEDREITLFDFGAESIDSLPVYKHVLTADNETVTNGWRLKITADTDSIVPGGSLTAFSVSTNKRTGLAALDKPLGAAEIQEYHTQTPESQTQSKSGSRARSRTAASSKRQAEDTDVQNIPMSDASFMYVWLGESSLVTAQTSIQEERTRRPTPLVPRLVSTKTVSDSFDSPDQTIAIVQQPDVHRVHITTVLENRSVDRDATVLLRYPLNGETLRQVKPRPTMRIKGGYLQWVYVLRPRATDTVVIEMELAM